MVLVPDGAWHCSLGTRAGGCTSLVDSTSWAQRASLGQAVCWWDQRLVAFLILGPLRALLLLDPRLTSTTFLRLPETSTLQAYRISFTKDLA